MVNENKPQDWYNGGWHRNLATRTIVYIPAGYYEFGTAYGKIEGAVQINDIMYQQLLDFVEKNEKGILRTDREDDLKIIHRLLDVLEKGTK